MATPLEMFNIQVPAYVTGKSLLPIFDQDQVLRDIVIFGYFGVAVNVTYRNRSYFHYPVKEADENLY